MTTWPAEPGLADVGRDPGPVVHGQLLRALEARPPGRRDRRGCSAGCCPPRSRGRPPRACGPRPRGRPRRCESRPRRARRPRGPAAGPRAPGHQARVSEVASPVGLSRARSPGCSSGAARSENSSTCRSKSFFSLADQSRTRVRAWSNRVVPVASSAVDIEAEVSSARTTARPLELVALQAQDRTEQQQHDQQDRHRPQGQQQPPPRGHDLREDPAVEDPSQHDGRRGDRQHGQEAVPLFEREMKHGACPVLLRPRRFPT